MYVVIIVTRGHSGMANTKSGELDAHHSHA